MRTRKLGIAAIAALAVGLPVAASATASADTIRVLSTTDTVDAGLVNGLPGIPGLISLYEAQNPGDTVLYTGEGTGRALTDAEAGRGDVVITHAPSLERAFVDGGYSYEAAGRQIFYSDYVIVGPQSDPAGVAADAPHDAVRAFEDIAAAGDRGQASFVSRNDNSGTNVEEQDMWGLTTTVQRQVATATSNPANDTTRFQPGTGGTYPSWYQMTGRGQGPNLQVADACADTAGCYTIVDRGTYNNLINSGTVTRLRIVSQLNDPSARGGQNLLTNPFSAYIVNPSRVSGVDLTGAQRFVNFLVSPSFQATVDNFPTATNPAFHADAYPSVTLTAPLPATVAAGTVVQLPISFADKLPGQPSVTGMPVTLQASTDGGKTFSSVATNPTDGNGNVLFTPTVGATMTLRLSLPDYVAPGIQSMFTASVQPLGTVSVPVVPKPTVIVPPAPKASKVGLNARKVAVTVNVAGTVKFVIKQRVSRRVRRGGKLRTVVTYKTVRTITRTVKKAGYVPVTLSRALPAGIYHVDIRVTNSAKKSQVTSSTRRVGKAVKKA